MDQTQWEEEKLKITRTQKSIWWRKEYQPEVVLLAEIWIFFLDIGFYNLDSGEENEDKIATLWIFFGRKNMFNGEEHKVNKTLDEIFTQWEVGCSGCNKNTIDWDI